MALHTTDRTETLDELVRRCWPDVRRWALAELGDPVVADDAVQEALVRLIQVYDRYDASRPFAPWLKTLVRRVCQDVRRRRSRHDDRSAPVVDVEHRPDPARALDLDRGARRATEAFALLTPRQREVWLLCERQGQSPSEAATTLRIEAGTARALLYQARRALRRHLLAQDPALADLVREP